MNVTSMGQVQATVQELLALRMRHLFSAADPEPTDAPVALRCGTVTTLSGYTEWVGEAELPISIGWDWRIDVEGQASRWRRDDLPRSNIQLLDEHGNALAWEDNLRVLATWVDALAWTGDVAQAVSAPAAN